MIHEARSIQTTTKKAHIAKQHTKAHPPQSPGQQPGANRDALYLNFPSVFPCPQPLYYVVDFLSVSIKGYVLIFCDAFSFPKHTF